ncbi:MAG: hypothetical protein ACQEW8_15120 [Actinomycetota bacterium]
MDPLSSVALIGLAIAVLAYAVYGAVRKGVRDGLHDDRERQRTNANGESGSTPTA